MNEASGRVFLFLQGPHGPFFRDLALEMARLGAKVRRVAFNAADEAEWQAAGPLDRYVGPEASYAAWLVRYLSLHWVTDIVLYGDSRPEHAQAIDLARARGIRCHCLEEGYLRPHWATYERGGSNGNSLLNEIGLDRIMRALGPCEPPAEQVPDRWGSHRAHMWHSARYYLRLLMPSRAYGRYRSRRSRGLWAELGLYLSRLASLPLRRAAQGFQVWRLLAAGRTYNLALLQLSFDSAMQFHSPYRCSAEFVADCVAGFAAGAAPDELLVFKAHPFEDGRERLGRVIADEAAHHGVAGRVLFLDGGNGLSALLDGARSVVTVNSTAGQQALWRGLPVAALGDAVYARPGLTSDQPLARFFAAPRPPRQAHYWAFRQFLIQTSQLRGSFYSEAGIDELLATLPQAMLAPLDPYETLLAETGAAAPAVAPIPRPQAAELRLAVG
ncbi:MAG TPA: capsule biosynthesis protein CapA [Thermohalobaculum sp.]|nr:capsule biosynthesis protein CapA [Thermohalobaculum sp.]